MTNIETEQKSNPMSFKNILIGVLLLLLIIMGSWVKCSFYPDKGTGITAQEESQVLLERIKSVTKLVTVEGYFSEIYDYQDYWGYDISIFRKKALVRVKAKVSMGYDLEKMKIESDLSRKTIIISDLPDPEIIAIDHDLDYYDITEGTFNAFNKDDYNKIHKNAKEFIRKQANSSDLKLAAEEQANKLHDIMKFMAEGSGWTVEFKPREVQPIDSLPN